MILTETLSTENNSHLVFHKSHFGIMQYIFWCELQIMGFYEFFISLVFYYLYLALSQLKAISQMSCPFCKCLYLRIQNP